MQEDCTQSPLCLLYDNTRPGRPVKSTGGFLPVKSKRHNINMCCFRVISLEGILLHCDVVDARAMPHVMPTIILVGAHGGRSGHLVLFLVALLFSKLPTFVSNNPEGNLLKSVYLTPKIALKFRRTGCRYGRLVTIAICFSHSLYRATKLVFVQTIRIAEEHKHNKYLIEMYILRQQIQQYVKINTSVSSSTSCNVYRSSLNIYSKYMVNISK